MANNEDNHKYDILMVMNDHDDDSDDTNNSDGNDE